MQEVITDCMGIALILRKHPVTKLNETHCLADGLLCELTYRDIEYTVVIKPKTKEQSAVNQKTKRNMIRFNSGVMIICDKCGKIDIHPIKHLKECDPEYEQARQENIDNDYKG